jgi:hypothetical protein
LLLPVFADDGTGLTLRDSGDVFGLPAHSPDQIPALLLLMLESSVIKLEKLSPLTSIIAGSLLTQQVQRK